MNDFLFFSRLLVFLVGTLLYGFLARELWRRPAVLPGPPVRLLAGCLCLWYAGCFLAETTALLRPPELVSGRPAALFDAARGVAWLLTFPLLAHTLRRLAVFDEAGRRRPHVFWLLPPYLTLGLFAVPAVRLLADAHPDLAVTAWRLYPRILLHSATGVASAVWILLAAARASREAQLTRFLRWLLGAIGVMMTLLVAGALTGESDPRAWAEGPWRLAAELAGLTLGLTFLYFVQRYNLLRLSLSYRSLRHFLGIVLLVLAMMFAGPALGIEGTAAFRRLLAWGLLVAVAAALGYSAARRALTARSRWLRRLLGETATPREIDRLTRRLHSPDLDEEAMRRLVATEVGRWLDTRATFLGPPEATGDARKDPRGDALARLWHHFAEDGAREGFNRLRAPSPELFDALYARDLHAVLPLSVGGALDGLLALGISGTGGGYLDGEMEAVQVVLRQLGAAVEARRELAARRAGERRAAEQERLRLLGMVSASLAHELKNPLSAMKALAQTVQEELTASAPGGEQARDLELIVEQIDRLDGVAREILAFSRPAAASGDVDLPRLVASAVNVVGHRAAERGVAIEAATEEVGTVAGSEAAWQTIVLNLLVNAVEHAPRGSRVRVALSQDGDGAAFTTENAGEPIEPALAARLFEPFATTSGTGLGLALVAERVAELGGAIAVDNRPGRIRFRVAVPRAAGAGQPLEEAG